MKRRNFIPVLVVLFLTTCQFAMSKTEKKAIPPTAQEQRQYLIQVLTRIADPVLTSLSNNELKKKMPVECQSNLEADRKRFTYLEALGRTLSGMAPWLELGPDSSAEGKLREKYIRLAVKSISNATDPASPDFMNFNHGSQPVVDAAFLAQALLRAPKQLWGGLSNEEKQHVIDALKSTRVITPGYNNWLLFSAEIEAALLKFTGQCDRMRIDYAIKEHMNWYKGDGMYGDGPEFHADYYNSFVIQPMLLEVLETLKNAGDKVDGTLETVKSRIRRYAQIQERLISPEATYPAIGRSIAYRFGAFQVLSLVSLDHMLPEEIQPQQVRAAMYHLVKRQIEMPGTFDENGWLTIGLAGHQPSAGESYISTGSLYLCTMGLLVLGLPPTDTFWQGEDKKWTALKVWNGEYYPIDHALK